MFSLDQMVHWWAYLSSCLSNDIVSTECNSRWGDVVVAGSVLALLIFVAAGYGFFRAHRDIRRKRVMQGARDIAVTEKLIDEKVRTGGERFVMELAERYREAFARSSLAGWRIHRDR